MTTATTRIHDAVLDCLRDLSGKDGRGSFTFDAMKQQVEQSVRGSCPMLPQQERFDLSAGVLALWNDLLRNGTISFGNPDGIWSPDAFHLSVAGHEVLRHRGREPSNPDGYMHHLKQHAALDLVSESYVKEALHTYNAGCYKAAAVMIGTATEGMILNLRECLVSRLGSLGKKVPKDLAPTEWRIKVISDGLERELEAHKARMPADLSGAFDICWVAFAGRVRMIRNKTGHPNSIDPVSHGNVLAALSDFPDFARLVVGLKAWITGHPF